jgi:competence protein ComEC
MVFDGGPAERGWDAGRSVLIPFLLRHGASRVDVAILSHPDIDHLGGLASLLEAMTVHRVIDSGDPVPSAAYERFLAVVDESGAQWLPAAPGDLMLLDEAQITILGPSRAPGRGAAAANATSVSFRLSIAGGFRYLNTGDATEREELDLLEAWPADSLRADLMKVGHHGSRTSSAPRLLRTVSPSLAIISSGLRNPYGHPHPRTLARLDSAGVPRVWRTDRHGTLCVEIDRRGWWRVEGEPAWRRPAAVP